MVASLPLGALSLLRITSGGPAPNLELVSASLGVPRAARGRRRALDVGREAERSVGATGQGGRQRNEAVDHDGAGLQGRGALWSPFVPLRIGPSSSASALAPCGGAARIWPTRQESPQRHDSRARGARDAREARGEHEREGRDIQWTRFEHVCAPRHARRRSHAPCGAPHSYTALQEADEIRKRRDMERKNQEGIKLQMENNKAAYQPEWPVQERERGAESSRGRPLLRGWPGQESSGDQTTRWTPDCVFCLCLFMYDSWICMFYCICEQMNKQTHKHNKQ